MVATGVGAAAAWQAGVRTVVDDLDVTLPSAVARKDREIAAAITRERSSTTAIPGSVQAEVRKGHVTLRGEVQWAHQREDTARAIAHVRGVRGVVNQITVKPLSEEQKADPADVERRVEDAIRRLAELDARSISVTTSVGVFRLEGSVHSLAEFQLAQRAAESAPGVTKVENELVVTA